MGEARNRGPFELRRAQAVPRIGGQPGQIQVGAEDVVDKVCPCGGELWDPAYRLKVLPKISPKNPTGQDQLISVQAWFCRACGAELKP